MQVTPCYPCLYFTALEKSNCPLFWLFFIKYRCLQIHQGIRSEINSILLKLLTCGSGLLQGASFNISYFTCRDYLFGFLISETCYGIFSLIFFESQEFKSAWWGRPASVGPEEGCRGLDGACTQHSAVPVSSWPRVLLGHTSGPSSSWGLCLVMRVWVLTPRTIPMPCISGIAGLQSRRIFLLMNQLKHLSEILFPLIVVSTHCELCSKWFDLYNVSKPSSYTLFLKGN